MASSSFLLLKPPSFLPHLPRHRRIALPPPFPLTLRPPPPPSLHRHPSPFLSLPRPSPRRHRTLPPSVSYDDSASLETEVKASASEQINDELEQETEESKENKASAVEQIIDELEQQAGELKEVKASAVEQIVDELEQQAGELKEVKASAVEQIKQGLDQQAEESKEVWNQAVEKLTEDAVKVEETSKQSAKESTEKVVGVLRDTTEQLREQAEKARAVLAATAQETAEKSKENLTLIAENAHDPIKDIAETALKAHSPEAAKKGAKIHDFCLGIPYGGFLVLGGLLWFIISGSTPAILFGVILGGILLALSVSSLKVWKQGNSSMPYIQGQAAITLLILIRGARRYFETKAFFPTAVGAIISAGMLGFYSYVYFSGGNPPKKVKVAPAT